jgi:uncharacterized integral membrane protein
LNTTCKKTRIFEVEKNGYEWLALVAIIALSLVFVVWKVLAMGTVIEFVNVTYNYPLTFAARH